MSHDPEAGPATPGDDARVFDLKDLDRAAVLLPPGVGMSLRRDLLAELAWAEQFPDDAALREALAFVRGRRDG